MEASAWILAIITIDRYLILVNSTWKQKYSKNIKFNLTVILLLIFTVIVINIPVAFLNGRSLISNQTTINVHGSYKSVECYSTSFMTFYQRFSLILECLCPLCIMVLFNSLLIKKTYKSTTRLKTKISLTESKSRSRTPNRQLRRDSNENNNRFLSVAASNRRHGACRTQNASASNISQAATSFNDLIFEKRIYLNDIANALPPSFSTSAVSFLFFSSSSSTLILLA